MGYFQSTENGWEVRQLIARSAGFAAVVWLLVSSAVPVLAQQQGYYRWTDQYGNVQHSDRPPPAGTKYDFILVNTGHGSQPATPPAAEPASEPLPAPAATPAANAPEQLTVEKNPAFCEQARSNLETLNTRARIRLKGEDGEYRYLTPEEKQEQRQRAIDMIAIHCE
jgi:hypothetical protein